MSASAALLAASSPGHAGPGAALQIFVVVALVVIAAGAYFLISAYRDNGQDD